MKNILKIAAVALVVVGLGGAAANEVAKANPEAAAALLGTSTD